ncbi:MAG: hypothetical protein V2I51_13675 [Anderseniella sp.]|jgi:hypothetical protein|nr:hypothetical protein [Anderseniella sp.]
MALLDLWNTSPEQLRDKQIQQLIAFSGAGRLLDGTECSQEFRSFLASVPSSNLKVYADQCLSHSFPDSGFALQDVVNEVGSRIGAEVEPGRYRGTANHVSFDGLWKFRNGHAIIVEVKTTDAYRIDLNVIASYRKALINKGSIAEGDSSMLLVVGRQDTGDLEAQIRGSRHAWDVRIISVDALLRLMAIKEEVEDPQIVQRIHSVLIPREFTRLDEIADILFSAAEEIKQETAEEEDASEDEKTKEPKFTPVAFHDACIARIQKSLDKTLIKRTRAQYSTPDKSTVVNCAVSKEHNPDTKPNYWFAFHPHQREVLESAQNAFVAFGCGTSKRLLLIPFSEFASWLDGMWITQKDDRMYWHVVIYRTEDKYSLHRKKGQKNVDVTQYLIQGDV